MNDCPPEVSLARLILEDEGFSPGDDLKLLVSRFARIESVPIPFEADGITIKPGSLERPQIVINSRNPPTRRKFTLAHELGHVLIPWHVGTICSHIDGNTDSEDEYYVQEGEANRFASELLVPTAWVNDLFHSTNDPAVTLKAIIDTVGISTQAATIKMMQCLPPGFVCTESHPGKSTQYHRSPGTVISPPYGEDLELVGRYEQMADGRFSFRHGSYRYRWWFFSRAHEVPTEKLRRPWREALADILASVPSERRKFVQQSLNGIVAAAHQNRGSGDDAYRYIVSRVAGEDYASLVIDYPDFRPFVVARLEELGRGKKGFRR
ncbi:MAG: ImmA/IrrE family metallo-endopeptidase [Rhodocyclaceae bacterium]|nr:ImmA/IrrE family metallo-endopeptidase [Rhodocyclaceae bacterium]